MTEEEKATQEAANKEVVDKINSIKDTPQFAAILNQHGKTYLESQESVLAAKYSGNAYNNVDSAYLESLGIEDRPEGKTSELVRKLGEDYIAAKAQLEKLKNKKPEGNEQDSAKQQLHDTQVATLQQQIAELTSTNEGLKTQGTRQKAFSSISNALIGESLDPNLSKELLGEIKALRINKIVDASKEVDGKTIYYNDAGEQYTNLNGLPMSAKEVTKIVFKDLFHEKTPGGNGSNDDKPHIKGDIVVIPNHQNIKSFPEFNKAFEEAMRAKGLTRKDDKYYDLQRNTRDHYNFKGLPTG